MQETRVRPLGLEDPLEKEETTHSSILAWEISCTEELGRLQSMGSQRARYDLMTKQQQTNFSMYILCKIKKNFLILFGRYIHKNIFQGQKDIAWKIAVY